jgi:signal transduction histidine kinase/CheY-like chemotaxis protein
MTDPTLLRALVSAARQAGAAGGAETALRAVVEIARDVTGADGAVVAVAETSDAFSPRACAPPSGGPNIPESALRTALDAHVPLVLGDALVIRVPILDVRPVVLAVTRRHGTWNDEEIAALETVALHAAAIMTRADAAERAHAHSAQLRRFGALTRLTAAAARGGNVFDAIAHETAALVGARAARVWVNVPEVRALHLRATSSGDGHFDAPGPDDLAVLPHGESVVGDVAQRCAPIFIRDVQQDARWRNVRFVREARLHAFAGIPLVAGDAVLGVLSILFGEPRDFTLAERDQMTLIAEQAAVAVVNARLFAESERRRAAAEAVAARLETLARLNRVVSASLDTESVLAGIARAAAELTGAPLVALWVADEATRTLSLRAVSHAELRADFPVTTLTYGTSISGRVAAERRTMNVGDIRIELGFTSPEWAVRHGLTSVLGVPILSHGDVLGVITFLGREPFDAEVTRPDVLDAFVAQAAIAIRNARLYADLAATHEYLARSQTQLVQTERLRALGEMAAGVAHDFNNLLAVVLGRTELLQSLLRDPAAARSLEVIRQAALDGAQTVRRIQEFTRTRQSRDHERVDVLEAVAHAVDGARPRWRDEADRRGVRYEVRVEGGAVPAVAGRRDEIREVFTNLLINALEAMPEGGACTFRVDTDRDRVTVNVTDTGIGMSEDVRRRVFEPFFSTKGARGTGLGLALAWGIVTRCGGSIDVESTPGHGSLFRVSFPVDRDPLPGTGTPSLTPDASRARILIVEDEPDVRDVLRDLLVAHGFTVIEARNGRDALERCETDPVDLVLSDISMPELSGWDLARACASKFPHLPIAFITGWGDRIDPTDLHHHNIRFLLPKPFQTNEVLRLVQSALTRPPDA